MFLCNDLFFTQVFMTSHKSWDKKNFHLLGSNMQQYQMCWYHIFWWESFLWLSFYHSGKYKFKTNERVFQLPFSANKIQTESSKNTIFLMWFKAITHQDTKFNCGKLTRNSEFFWFKLVVRHIHTGSILKAILWKVYRQRTVREIKSTSADLVLMFPGGEGVSWTLLHMFQDLTGADLAFFFLAGLGPHLGRWRNNFRAFWSGPVCLR